MIRIAPILLILLGTGAYAQDSGVTFAGGVIDPGSFSVQVSYFHSVLLNHLYVDVGFRHFETGSHAPTDDFQNTYFSNLNHMFVGLRLGDFVFLNPRLSLNWYGKYTSLGWGVSAGIQIPLAKALRAGLYMGYDQVRFDNNLDRYGVTKPYSVGLMLTFLPL